MRRLALLALVGLAVAGAAQGAVADAAPLATFDLEVAPQLGDARHSRTGVLDPVTLAVLPIRRSVDVYETVLEARVSRAGPTPVVDVLGSAVQFDNVEERIPLATATATAKLSYLFRLVQEEVLPPGVEVDAVPLWITARGHASTAGNVGASAQAAVFSATLGFDIRVRTVCSMGECDPRREFPPDLIRRDVELGLLVDITLLADGGANIGFSNEPTNASFQALADPTIEIDPGFAFRDAFRIEFSPNLEAPPGQPIPEPATLTLLGLSLASLGAARRWWSKKR